jgi:alpha-beta hydrolase superfamily lysophospholipase
VFAQVRAQVTDKLPAADRVPGNRYFSGSPLNSYHYTSNWNRSFVLMPDGAPRGAVVLLHGLTDSPYSLRHIAVRYREQGFVAIAIRLPGHGTVPAGLTTVRDADWRAATRLAVRTARELVKTGPLHIVGYSNGGALALQYALDALENDELAAPDRLVLISPMIGITSFARFAGVLGWPSVFPAFAKAAWLDVIPEYNPFKYNSFPVNAARQSSQVANGVREQLLALADDGRLGKLPPILTFQSVLDSTVFTSAVIDSLYIHLPQNGSELVLFDRNRKAEVRALMRPENTDLGMTLLPPPPRNYAVSIVTNSTTSAAGAEAQTVAAGATATTTLALDAGYPSGMFSLSHIALPFPPHDGLYGSEPLSTENFGLHLGKVEAHGERGSLVVSVDTLMRASSNPFFDFLLERIDATLPAQQPGSPTGQ